jgi:predicted aldo/keto reductase-like oxidoreductase
MVNERSVQMSDIPKLPQINLGKSGLQVSRVGLGGFHQVEISSEIVDQVISTFLDVGGTYIETARGYGHGASEEKIGRALEGRRDKVVLASKSGARDADGMQRDLETSLTLLRTDHIDFYFFHCVNTLAELDQITGSEGALGVLLKAQDEGVIKGLGFSSHRPPLLYAEAIKRLPLSVILIWDNYLEEQYLPEIQQEVYPLAREYGVGITAMKPLADGFLYQSPENALRYVLGSGSDVLICGMNSVDHVLQAAQAVAKGPATAEERENILQTAPELGQYVCRQCGLCSLDLMALFRLEGYVDRQMVDYLPHDPANYALRLRLSGWFNLVDIARERYIQAGWDAEAFIAEAVKVLCPYGINVERKTRFALAKLRGETLNTL